MIQRLFYETAYEQAIKSDMNFNHGAIVIYRGKIVGKGYNTYINDNNKYSIHAEVSAINSALKIVKRKDLANCELIIIRVNKNGESSNSYPCKECRKFINFNNIKKVYYSS